MGRGPVEVDYTPVLRYAPPVADLVPFCAYRPPPNLAPRVASPPYDVVTSSQARELAHGNDQSFLRVSRPEIDLENGIDEHDDRVYARGRDNLLELVERQVLVRDPEPHLYVYAQRMGDHRQMGIVGCARVADYVSGRIKKHEKTRPDKEDDRTRHIETLEAHDEPVFLTYRARPAIDELMAELTRSTPVYDFTSDDGVDHKLWVVPAGESRELARVFAAETGDLYVADGHHRSAAAARVHDTRRGDGGEHDVFLAVVFPHDQMNILPYNRVVTDREGRSPEAILEALRQKLDVVSATRAEPDVAASFGFYIAGRWYRVTALPGSFDPADPIGSLEGQICQELLLGPVFGVADPRRDKHVDFVGGIHGARELERRVDEGRATAAIYLRPTTIEQVMRVSDAGEVMPPKSTWFEPKLKSGLFVHTF
jgi:uncharacterized protein (DUF1015 family)